MAAIYDGISRGISPDSFSDGAWREADGLVAQAKAGDDKAFATAVQIVDSLYLSYPGDVKPEVLAVLQKLKALAQSDHPEQQSQAQYPLGSHIFEVKDKGARLFPFILEDNAYRIQVSKPGKRLPMAYVKVSAEYLAHKGPVEVGRELQELLSEFGDLTGSNMVSWIDLAADFTSPVVMDSWHRSAWVTRATEIHSYAKDQVFTGWTIGMGGIIGCRTRPNIWP